jgi:hypothetical protein
VTTRHAACSCGQLRVTVEGEPVRISICHCLACQRRTGSVFGAQARFETERVRTEGRHTDFARVSDEGDHACVFSFCPDCGATVFYRDPAAPELTAIPVGAFADRDFPPPRVSVWEGRRHPWVAVPDSVQEHWD